MSLTKSFKKSHEKFIRNSLGRAYRKNKFKSEDSEFVVECYRKIVEINNELFEKIPYQVKFVSGEPYKNAREMRERVISENVIYISTDGEPNKFMTQEENLKGRAIHDVFAHMVCGCPFTFKGEYNAYLEQRKHYPIWTWGVLFAEIPMQTASYYVENNFDYEQRAIEAPAWLMAYCEKFLAHDYSVNSVLKSFAKSDYVY